MKQIILSLIILTIITIILLFYSIKYKKENFIVPESIAITIPKGEKGDRGPSSICPSDCSSDKKGNPGVTSAPTCIIKAGLSGDQGDSGEKGLPGIKGQDIAPRRGPRGPQGPPGFNGNSGKDGSEVIISSSAPTTTRIKGLNGQKGASGAMGLDARVQEVEEYEALRPEDYPGEIFEINNKKPSDFISNGIDGQNILLGYNLDQKIRDNFEIEKNKYISPSPQRIVNDIQLNLSVPYMQVYDKEIKSEISLYDNYNYFIINIPDFDNYKDMLIFCNWIDKPGSLAVYHVNINNNNIQMITNTNNYWYATSDSEKFKTQIISNKIRIYYKSENTSEDDKAKIICFYFNND